MKKFTVDEIQNKFDSLPEELQEAITSSDVNDALEDIAKQNGLQLDQLGELVDLVGLIILGLVPSSDFIREFSREAEVSEKQARRIAEDVNGQIFAKLRTSIRIIETRENTSNYSEDNGFISNLQNSRNNTFPPKPPHIADLEKAGGFTIEHDGVNNLGRGVGDEEGVGSDNLRAVPARNKWSPLGQTVIPTRNLGSIPVTPPNQQNVATNTVPASVSAPIQDQNPNPFTAPISTPVPPPTPTIPKKIENPTPIVNQNPVAETKPEIKTNIQEEIEKEIASALKAENISPIKTEKTTPVVPEIPTEKVSSEPLADQLLSMLNKKTVEKDDVQTEKREGSVGEKISTIPNNLPIEKTTDIPQPTVANVPPPIKIPTNPNPLSPKPPLPQSKPRSFDPYREPIK